MAVRFLFIAAILPSGRPSPHNVSHSGSAGSLAKHLQAHMSERFYSRVLRIAEAEGVLDSGMSILVVAGGSYDRETFLELGYKDVTISNVDVEGAGGADFAPYCWTLQHAERLTLPDSSVDVVVVHAGLHHCRSPHAALAEMYRVARRTVIVVEARDSFMVRCGIKLGLTPQYEVEAVVAHDYMSGGVENSGLPNFVYRWTENEVEKVVRSLDPSAPPRLRYVYGLRLPVERLMMRRAGSIRALAAGLAGLARVAQSLFPRQGNCFGFIIAKPDAATSLFPWVQPGGRTVDRAWCQTRYRQERG